MPYSQRIIDTLKSYSVEQDDNEEMLSEWYDTGKIYDDESCTSDCELCEHKNIRRQHLIRNQETGITLQVGSECVKKVQFTMLNEYGDHLTFEESKKKRTEILKEQKAERVLGCLALLEYECECEFNFAKVRCHYRKYKAFTPKMLSRLIWKMNEFGIQYNTSDFKISFNHRWAKQQLREMEEWKVLDLMPYFSYSQKKWCCEYIGVCA